MTVKVDETNGVFCAKCIELNVYGSGRSAKEAVDNVVESVKMFIRSAPKDELISKTKSLHIKDLSEQKIVDSICSSMVNLI